MANRDWEAPADARFLTMTAVYVHIGRAGAWVLVAWHDLTERPHGRRGPQYPPSRRHQRHGPAQAHTVRRAVGRHHPGQYRQLHARCCQRLARHGLVIEPRRRRHDADCRHLAGFPAGHPRRRAVRHPGPAPFPHHHPGTAGLRQLHPADDGQDQYADRRIPDRADLPGRRGHGVDGTDVASHRARTRAQGGTEDRRRPELARHQYRARLGTCRGRPAAGGFRRGGGLRRGCAQLRVRHRRAVVVETAQEGGRRPVRTVLWRLPRRRALCARQPRPACGAAARGGLLHLRKLARASTASCWAPSAWARSWAR
ncbi:hypothetical protein G6F65_017237 [Rhizopus arrhizus]|nr:hypothetical protein G6F65_017237 [Rhizopus arrhizus]